jgi:hypothetical protein
MGSAARHSTGRKATSRQSKGNRPPTRQKPKSAPRKTKKLAPAVPLTSLVRIADALSIVRATVDVAATAIDRSDDPELSHAATVLNEHAYYPLEKLSDEIGRHAAICTTPMHKETPKRKRRRAKTPYRKWKKP